MQSCVKSGPDIVSKVESDMGSLRHILKADIITPRTHQRLRLLLDEDLPELIREARELRGTIGRQYLASVDYEYNIEWTHKDGNTVQDTDNWMSLADAQQALEDYDTAVKYTIAKGGASYFTGRLIKRRKAGEVERV